MTQRTVLPVGDVVTETFRFLWDNRRDLLRLIGLPVLVLSILSIVIGVFLGGPPKPGAEAPASFYVGQFALIAASTVFYVMFAVAWHRRCLRPAEQLTIWTALRWDRRKTVFLVRSIVIAMMVGLSALSILLISSILAGMVAGVSAIGGVEGQALPRGLVMIVSLLTLVPAFLLNARLALWLPPAAIDQPVTLHEAWQSGEGSSWRLFAILLMATAPGVVLFMFVILVLGFAGAAMGVAGTLTFALIKSLLATFVNYLTIAAGVSALSMAYKRLRPPHDPGMPFFMNR